MNASASSVKFECVAVAAKMGGARTGDFEKEAGRRFSPELQFGRLHLEFLQKNDDVIFAEADQFRRKRRRIHFSG